MVIPRRRIIGIIFQFYCLIKKASVDSGFWLLDSGASVNVITKEALQHFQHTEVQSFANPMQAANGSDVAMEGFLQGSFGNPGSWPQKG